jgi:hypothetical protein
MPASSSCLQDRRYHGRATQTVPEIRMQQLEPPINPEYVLR